MKVGIIGAGLQARRRGPIVNSFPDSEIVSITSLHPDMSKPLAKNLNCKVAENWKEVLNDDLDAVIVCTHPDSHAEISIEAMKKGIHVLCEKPLCISLNDASEMIKTAKDNSVILKCGFNHRYHPAIEKIKQWVDANEIGKIRFIRTVYGIGARPQINEEWRSDPKIVAGGQFMEQGIHCVDLMRWFIGNPQEVTCLTSNPHSLIEPLEDNAFVIYKTDEGQLVNIHSSLLQWKNHFSFEVYGTKGYASVFGLGGSYGTEHAILGKRDPDAPFSEYRVQFGGADPSWKSEWDEFKKSIETKKEPQGNGSDGYESLRLVFGAYQSNKEKRTIRLDEDKSD